MDDWEREMENMVRAIRTRGFNFDRPLMKGFTLAFTPDGQPFFRTFGDPLMAKGPREPLIEQYVDKDTLRVVCEIPGAEKEQIKVEATEETMDIKAETPGRNYHANFTLKEPVDPRSSQATYRNGILEVKFRLRGNANKGYHPIKVE
jgi:HSP20 family protein